MATKKEILAQQVARAVGAGKSVALDTVDFNDPNRPKTCLDAESSARWNQEPHQRQPLPQHGYLSWSDRFNPRQLPVHAQLLKAILNAGHHSWPIRDLQCLGDNPGRQAPTGRTLCE